MQSQTLIRAVQPTPLVAPMDMHVLNDSTKISIRMKEGVERIVPPDFVGLALAAGALPAEMYVKQYGQYRNLDGAYIGEPRVYHDDDSADIVIMEEKETVQMREDELRPAMEDTTEIPQEQILAAIQKVLDIVAAKPDQRAKYLAGDGRPKVPALEEVLGRDITASQRDAAWASMTLSA